MDWWKAAKLSRSNSWHLVSEICLHIVDLAARRACIIIVLGGTSTYVDICRTHSTDVSSNSFTEL